ncbi:phosphoglycerate mutase-like protein [Teratosphaeria nubilosa]|uniref:Phosphoglycerate mutase-like protein n=1 Tax=Teratosphaeria nubilosa TaxID=161662 RepID=A0A6G1KV80_9PEZI|nr:phosphoglycerate mutase-like protein [Teratosphaeria nubilosa]
MVLEVIYVVRHGYRSNWVVDASTGTYSSSYPTPTGIPSDPALAVYGVKQSQELASHLLTLSPPIDKIYSSPFYRCIQTLSPFTDKLVEQKGKDKVQVILEPGLGEFYGLARFDHPRPATLEVLNRHFLYLTADPDPVIAPSSKGESIPQLHDRVAYCLHHIIRQADRDPKGPKALVICTHAASMICIGRALTGSMPEDEGEEDFRCFTCSFSKYVRKSTEGGSREEEEVQAWDPQVPDSVPHVGWKGTGVAGGWECEVNGDCSFLSGGEERGW